MSKVNNLFKYTAFLAVLLLSACSDFHAPVADYLDEYANRAAIGSQAISVPTERDIDSIECVSSETAVTITFFLRNPRSYEIQPALTFNNPGLNPVNGLMSQSPNRQSITLTFLQSYLASNDRGTDFSGTISLTEAATGRPFPSWNYSLRCNTPPPRPEGARVMLDLDTNNYVLCFNLDLTNPVHQDDIAFVRINGTSYDTVDVDAGGSPRITFVDTRLSSNRPVTLNSLPNQPEFVPGDVPVYFSTGIPQSAATQNFTITVEDVMGLSRTASTSTAGNMLAPVTVTDMSGNPPDGSENLILEQDPGGYSVRLSHTESGVTIHWSNTELTGSSSVFPHVLTFTQSGDLEVWATRTGYVDSDRRTIHLICRNNQYYVDPASGDDSNPGTRSQPFQTIEHAITQFIDPTDADNTIFLLGNVTSANGGGTSGVVDIDPADAITLTIDGSEVSGKATIDGNNSKRCLYVNATSHTVNLTLRDLNIKNGYTSGGGAGIYFNAGTSGSSLSLVDCLVQANSIISSSGCNGGGIYFRGSNLSIDNSLIRNNRIETSAASYGAGIYMLGTGSPATAHIASTDGTTEISVNTGRVTGAPCMGGGIYANNINLTISGGTISGNTANSEENGSGGGIYQASGSLTIENGAIISGNWGARSAFQGRGGGIAFYGTNLDINGAEIFGNTASTQGSGWGGGVYVENAAIIASTVNLTGVDINTNWASTGSAGYGGGLYAIRSGGETTNINLTGGSITGNTASNRDGLGGGIYITTNSSAGLVGLYSLSGSNVEISGNRATTGSTAFGYGGGIYVGPSGQVVWESGTISGNQANENGTDVTDSRGEGIYIQGASGYTTSFNFAGGTIDEGVSTITGNVVYLNADSRFFFRGDTFIESNDPNTAGGIYLNHAASPSSPPVIQAVGYLTASTVANLVPSTYTWSGQILTGDTSINYYKFTVESDGSTDYCINANGELSRIVPVTTATSLQLDQTLSSVAANTFTYEITTNIDLFNGYTFTVASGLHVRIIPNLSFAFDHNSNGQLFSIQDGGNLLFGDPAQNIEIELTNSERQQHLFDLTGAGSLVLRNITVKNAQQPSIGTLTNSALVASGSTTGTSSVVLEDFIYLEDTAVSPIQSTQSALQLDTGSVYHFVSGSITGFNVSDPEYGGVANIKDTGQLTIHGGTFSGNTTTGTPANSVSGNLSGLDPSGLVLE